MPELHARAPDPVILAEEEARVRLGENRLRLLDATLTTAAPIEVVEDRLAVPAPKPAPVPAVAPLTLAAPTINDVDRLWDWIRRDQRDEYSSVFPYTATTSVGLHQVVQSVIDKAPEGLAAFYAIHWKGDHVGFTALDPILSSQAPVHLYLCRTVRGQGVAIGRALCREAAVRHPDLSLMVVTSNPRIQRFARRAGFNYTRFVLTQTEVHDG
jgi:hypothetical protein